MLLKPRHHPKEDSILKKNQKGFVGYIIVLAIFLAIALVANSTMDTTVNRRIEYPALLDAIDQGNVKAVAIRSNTLVGLYKTGGTTLAADFPERGYDFETTIGSDFLETCLRMQAQKTGADASTLSVKDLPFTVEYRANVTTPWYLEWLPYILVTVIMLLAWYFIMAKQTGGGKGLGLGFGRNRARVTEPGGKKKVTFADVAGAEEEKTELAEMVDFLKNPKAYNEMGARIPKGVLLVGPPGTGKTLLARAVAGEANAPFFSISGSDFVEMFVGVGASRVRDLFDQAKKAAPSIIFIDEIDAVGRHRGAGLGGGHDEREQTLNQLLVEMDGFSKNEGVIVMAATNRRDILDPALLRPGRFDRQVTVNYPDLDGRVQILKVHSRGKKLSKDVDLENIAKRMPYSSGADLENVMNEGALLAVRRKAKSITQQDLVDAVSRVQMGPEKRSHKVTASDRRLTAYHEAGHAVISHLLPECDDVHLVTIVPRGQAGGYTLSLPSEENDSYSRTKMLGIVCMMLGGNAAERVALKEITTGASSDIKRATSLVHDMVTKYGMSEKIGAMYLGNDQEVFVGMEFGQSREFSEQTAAMIDEEVSRILKESYDRAIRILTENMDKLVAVAESLLERDTLSRKEFEAVMNGEALPPMSESEMIRPQASAVKEDPETAEEEDTADNTILEFLRKIEANKSKSEDDDEAFIDPKDE